jgi:hypothetical protein
VIGDVFGGLIVTLQLNTMVGDALGGYSVALQVEQVDGVEASGKGLQDGNAIDDEKVNNE